MNTEHAESILGPRGHVGRARRAPGQLWQVPLLLAGLAALIGVAITAPSRGENPYSQIQSQLSQLRDGLQPGREKPVNLVQRAEELLAGLSQFPRKAGEIHFLAGSAYFRLAEHSTGEAQAASQRKAIHHLDQARALGVAATDLPALRYRLGLSLYQQGKDHKNALELMSQSVDKGADRARIRAVSAGVSGTAQTQSGSRTQRQPKAA